MDIGRLWFLAFVYINLLVARLVEHLTYFRDFLGYADEQNCKVIIIMELMFLPYREIVT